nr:MULTISPECIES: transposase [unclassified Thioalkalivibrio]
MTRARKELVSVETTPYYHCICRCVRRAFLCGEDSYSGKNYEHRRGWVLERLRELQGVSRSITGSDHGNPRKDRRKMV